MKDINAYTEAGVISSLWKKTRIFEELNALPASMNQYAGNYKEFIEKKIEPFFDLENVISIFNYACDMKLFELKLACMIYMQKDFQRLSYFESFGVLKQAYPERMDDLVKFNARKLLPAVEKIEMSTAQIISLAELNKNEKTMIQEEIKSTNVVCRSVNELPMKLVKNETDNLVVPQRKPQLQSTQTFKEQPRKLAITAYVFSWLAKDPDKRKGLHRDVNGPSVTNNTRHAS